MKKRKLIFSIIIPIAMMALLSSCYNYEESKQEIIKSNSSAIISGQKYIEDNQEKFISVFKEMENNNIHVVHRKWNWLFYIKNSGEEGFITGNLMSSEIISTINNLIKLWKLDAISTSMTWYQIVSLEWSDIEYAYPTKNLSLIVWQQIQAFGFVMDVYKWWGILYPCDRDVCREQ